MNKDFKEILDTIRSFELDIRYMGLFPLTQEMELYLHTVNLNITILYENVSRHLERLQKEAEDNHQEVG